VVILGEDTGRSEGVVLVHREGPLPSRQSPRRLGWWCRNRSRHKPAGGAVQVTGKYANAR
jgi:hypothetical protein